MRHTRGYWTGRPAAYFALHQTGFFLPPPLLAARWALTPPFHHHLSRLPGHRLYVFCDTVRQHALKRAARAWGEPCAASCPVVSGLSSPNSNRARRYPRLGIKELGATTRPQNRRHAARTGGSGQAWRRTDRETAARDHACQNTIRPHWSQVASLTLGSLPREADSTSLETLRWQPPHLAAWIGTHTGCLWRATRS